MNPRRGRLYLRRALLWAALFVLLGGCGRAIYLVLPEVPRWAVRCEGDFSEVKIGAAKVATLQSRPGLDSWPVIVKRQSQGPLTVRDLRTGAVVDEWFDKVTGFGTVAFSRDGGSFAGLTFSGDLHLANIEKGIAFPNVSRCADMRKKDESASPYSVTLSPSGKYVACVVDRSAAAVVETPPLERPAVHVVEAETGKIHLTLYPTEKVFFSADDCVLFHLTQRDHKAFCDCWDLSNKRRIGSFPSVETILAVKPDGRAFLTIVNGRVSLFDVDTQRHSPISTPVTDSFAFSPDGRFFVNRMDSRIGPPLHIWRTATG